MSLLSKEDILKQPLKTEEVEIPEWGGTVRVRELTAKERLELSSSSDGAEGPAKVKTYLSLTVSMGLVDNKGNRLFNGEEMNALLDSSALVIDQLYNVIARLSGLRATVEIVSKN